MPLAGSVLPCLCVDSHSLLLPPSLSVLNMSSSGCEQLSPLSFTSELLLPCALVPVRSLRMEKTLRSCGVARGGMAGVGCGGELAKGVLASFGSRAQ